MKSKIFSALAAALAVACSLSAQTTLSGKYALVERGLLANGQAFVALGTITVDAAGRVSGSEYLRGTAGAADLVLDGTYNAADGSLAATYSTTNSDGDSVAIPLNYRVVAAAGALHAIRTDLGVVSNVELIPLSTAATTLKGQFLLLETNVESANASFVSVSTLNLDGTQVTGRSTRKTFGPETAYDVAGTFTAGADGAGTLQLLIPVVTDDGTTYTTATYRCQAIDAKQLVAVRADAGVLTSVEVTAAQ